MSDLDASAQAVPRPAHPEEAAFVAAIRRAPGDRTARLVYADWLQERGEAFRAEHLRAAVAGTDGLCSHPPGRPALAERPGQHPWYARLVLLAEAIRDLGYGVRWGLVERVTCPGDVWVGYAEHLLARHPVREVVLTTTPRIERLRPWNPESGWAAYSFARLTRWVPVAPGSHIPSAIVGMVWPDVSFTFRRPSTSCSPRSCRRSPTPRATCSPRSSATRTTTPSGWRASTRWTSAARTIWPRRCGWN